MGPATSEVNAAQDKITKEGYQNGGNTVNLNFYNIYDEFTRYIMSLNRKYY